MSPALDTNFGLGTMPRVAYAYWMSLTLGWLFLITEKINIRSWVLLTDNLSRDYQVPEQYPFNLILQIPVYFLNINSLQCGTIYL